MKIQPTAETELFGVKCPMPPNISNPKPKAETAKPIIPEASIRLPRDKPGNPVRILVMAFTLRIRMLPYLLNISGTFKLEP